MSPLAPAYTDGYQWSSLAKVSVAQILVPLSCSLVMHLKAVATYQCYHSAQQLMQSLRHPCLSASLFFRANKHHV